MATLEKDILGINLLPESGIFIDRVGNQIAATNEVGNQLCIVMSEQASDAGFHCNFKVPLNYAGSGVIKARGIVDGAPGATAIALGITGLPLVDGEAADAAYGTEDLGENTSSDADKDEVEVTITLSNLTLVAGDNCYYYFFVDNNNNDYTGNFLLTSLVLSYSDT